MKIIDHFSPNTHARKSSVDTLVLHYTDMKSSKSALRLLCDPEKKVSAHYLVEKTGTIYCLVPEDKVAYHAGLSHWRGCEGLNETSIGIEIDNLGHQFGPEAFPDIQMNSLLELISGIRTRHKIPNHNIVAHSDIAPTRKKDPGELFPWDRLHGSGHGIWADVPPSFLRDETYGVMQVQQIKAAQMALKKMGFQVSLSGVVDDLTEAVITAFQRHFFPLHITGMLDTPTEARIHQIVKLYP